MKRISEFKGYRTKTEYDVSQGTFVQVQVGWDEFEPQPSRSAEVVPFRCAGENWGGQETGR